MTQEQYTTKERKFQHLTKEKRAQIEILLHRGLPKTKIAEAVGIARSTLYNELKRGTVEQLDSHLKKYQKYFWDVGQRVYEKNRVNCRPSLKLINAYDFIRYTEKQILENKLSPDSICREAKMSGRFENIVSTKTLCRWTTNLQERWCVNVGGRGTFASGNNSHIHTKRVVTLKMSRFCKV